MGIINKIEKALDVLLSEENENFEKGTTFERYVVNLFNNSTYVSIQDWTRDLSDKHKGIKVESDSGPDLIVRYKPTDERFAVECKYRSHLCEDDKLVWTTFDKLKQYNQYWINNKIPMFILIGMGGSPDDVDRMFCIPLHEAKYSELYPSVGSKHAGASRRML